MPHVHLGQFLIERGWVTHKELTKAFAAVDAERLIALAVAKGILVADQAERLQEKYGTSNSKIGDKAVKQGLITPEQLDYLLRLQKNDIKVLGGALVTCGVLDATTFENAVQAYHEVQVDHALRQRVLPVEFSGRADVIALIGMVESLLSETTGLALDLGAPTLHHGDWRALDISIGMQLGGEFNGRMVFTVDHRFADLLSRGISGHGIPEASVGDLTDAVGEFCNMVLGRSSAALAGRGHELAFKTPRPLTLPTGNLTLAAAAHCRLDSEFGRGDLFIDSNN